MDPSVLARSRVLAQGLLQQGLDSSGASGGAGS